MNFNVVFSSSHFERLAQQFLRDFRLLLHLTADNAFGDSDCQVNDILFPLTKPVVSLAFDGRDDLVQRREQRLELLLHVFFQRLPGSLLRCIQPFLLRLLSVDGRTVFRFLDELLGVSLGPLQYVAHMFVCFARDIFKLKGDVAGRLAPTDKLITFDNSGHAS